MESYETIIIFDNRYDKDEPLKDTIKMFGDMCQEFTGTKYKIKREEMGERKLAYPLRDCTSGYYVLFTWQGTKENVDELERCFRINDKVLKFLTVKRDAAECELEEFLIPEDAISEQRSNAQVDALDVLLGFAEYSNRKEVK